MVFAHKSNPQGKVYKSKSVYLIYQMSKFYNKTMLRAGTLISGPALAYRCHHHAHESDDGTDKEEPDGCLAPDLLEYKNAPAAADDQRGLSERVANALTQGWLQR